MRFQRQTFENECIYTVSTGTDLLIVKIGKPGQGKPGQIYLIVDFADGRTTWAFIINRSVPVSPAYQSVLLPPSPQNPPYSRRARVQGCTSVGFAGSEIRPATARNNKQQNTLAVLILSCACNSDGEDGDGSAG